MSDDTKDIKIDVGFGAKLDVDLDLTETVKALTVEPSEVLGSIMAAKLYKWNGDMIFEQKLRAIDHHYALKRQKLLREAELLAIEETKKIKEIKMPLESEISPPVDALRIFYDKEHYRSMLAKLIAATFDKNSKVHPSFVEIIKRLTECDADLIYDLFALGQTLDITVAKTVLVPSDYSIIPQEFTEMLLVKYHEFGDFQPRSLIHSERERSNSIVNLTNLGLLTFDSKFTESKSRRFGRNEVENIEDVEYSFVLGTEHYKEMVDIYEPEYIVSALKVNLFFTTLGYDFYSICIA